MKNKLTKYGMMIVAAVLLVAMAFAGAASAAPATADKTITVNNWNEIRTNIADWNSTGGTYMLTLLIPTTFDSSDAAGNVDAIINSNVTIKPAVTTGEVTLDAKQQGRFFRVFYKGNLTICGNGSATLTLTGGLSNDNGGCLNINCGAFNMYSGSSITNCTAQSMNGGAVYILYGAEYGGGPFNFYGGNIINCTAAVGGGIAGSSNAVINMNGGSIINCNATSSIDGGGGVSISSSTLTMTAGNITKCSALSKNGGGVYINNNGMFTMNSGNITECSAPNGNGGGVCIGKGNPSRTPTFIMNGGSISGNSALVGGEIYDNSFSSNSFVLSGDVHIDGNSVVLCQLLAYPAYSVPENYPNITIGSGFSGSVSNITLYVMNISTSVSVENVSAWVGHVVVKNGASVKDKFALSSAYSGYSLSVSGNDLVLAECKDTYVKVSDWDQLVANVSGWTDTTTMRTVVLTNTNPGAYKNTTGTAGGYGGIPVTGLITITPAAGTGEITIDANQMGRIFNVNGGTLTLTGNSTSATLNLTGGIPSDNGGGIIIHNGGTLTLNTGVNITNCTCGVCGGGVYVEDGTFNMNGGSITGCCADSVGGGVVVLPGSTFNVNGTATITGNTGISSQTSNVLLASSTGLHLLAGGFTGKIGLSVNSVPSAVGGAFGTAASGATGAGKFFADDDATLVGSISGSSLVWAEYQNPYVEVNTWAGLNKSVSEWTDTTEARVVAVSADITDRVAGNETDGIAVKGKVILTTTTSPAGGNKAVVNGNGIGRLFNVTSTGNLTLVGNGSSVLNLTGGKLTGIGEAGAGIIINGGNLTLNTGAMITNCSANDDGGGVYIKKGTFTMNDGCISECKSMGAGGAIVFGANTVFVMNGGTIINCSASTYGGGVSNINSIFTMTGGTITCCSASYGGGIFCSGGTVSLTGSSTISRNTATIGDEILTLNSITLSGTANIGATDVGLVNMGTYPNITATSFTGSVANITLYDSGRAENPSVWLGQVVVKNGASVKDKFALSSTYSGYALLASGNDLVLGKDIPTGSLFVNISNANDNPVTIALNYTSGSNINTTTVAAGVTNITFSNLADGSYSLYGSYVNGTATTGVSKLVTLTSGAGYVELSFPVQNVSSVVTTSAESGATTPKVTVDGLDTLAAAESAPATGKETVYAFNATGEVYNASNTNQRELRDKIVANNSNAVINFLNFTVTKSTVDISTGATDSVTVIADPGTLLTIYMEYDMTNRQNIQVWRHHSGTAEELQELASGDAPADGKYKRDGNKGVFIYSQHFSSYTISSSAVSSPSSPSSGGSSSHHAGGSQLAQSPTAAPTVEPTAVATAVPTVDIPSPSATTQPTRESPAPFVGLVAGLGAAAVVLGRLRK